MGESSKIFENESVKSVGLKQTRILVFMAVVTLLGSVLAFGFLTRRFGLGVLIGGILSFLNYYWLKFSLKMVFQGAIEGVKPKLFGAQYIIRYLVFGLVIALIYITDILPIAAVILGLCSFAFAVVLEGIFRIAFSVKGEI